MALCSRSGVPRRGFVRDHLSCEGNWNGVTDVVGADLAAENGVCLHLVGRRETGLEIGGLAVLSGVIGGNVVFWTSTTVENDANLEARSPNFEAAVVLLPKICL